MAVDQEEILEKASILERLDYTLRVVGVRNWVFLLFFILLFALTLVWSFTGTIPITVSGKGLVFLPEASIRVRSPAHGVVTGVQVKEGDLVHEGDVLVILDNNRKIVAPVEGKISWIDTIWGNVVSPEEILLWIQRPTPPEGLTILGFFPLNEGRQIKKGMEANIALSQVNTERYGMARGIVKEVLQYPVCATDYFMQKIPSKVLREYLVSGSTPTIGIVVEPVLDPKNPSGWRWTSQKGPTERIEPGATGEMRIILEEWKPITFLFPILQEDHQ